jgi:cell division protein FtsI (penicillin-binding protein 3)/stage V sporulation protein D (sporulation-specific penicillin-binding protein)
MRDKQANRRIRLLLVVFALLFAGMLGRAAWLQVVQAARLSKMAEGQERHTVTTPAGRGTIFDRTGVQLAIGEQMTTVYADPAQVVNAAEVADTAHTIFGIDANALYVQLQNKKSQFVYVQRFADPAKAKLFLAKHFTGVDSYPEEKRFYPQLTVAPQVIGYAGVDNTGLEGLEYQYNKQLSGRPGKQTVITDPLGRAIDVISSRPAQQGADVFSTIDHTIQAQAELVLRQTLAEWKAKAASAIVMDPTTGEVLAMAQAPGYDDNDSNLVSQGLQRNRPVTDSYEPGSTFKLVTITAALSEGIVKPTTRFILPYELRYGPCDQCTVHDAEIRPTETLSVAQILAQSSNVGAVTIAEKLGPAMLSKWIAKFGFGKPTGIDFPGESPGFVLPLDQWNEATIGNNPIGQGISVTPIQMASVYAAVANGGVWIQPHLVSRVGGRALQTWKRRRLMSPAVDAQVKAMLTGVVADAGATGTAAAIPGYAVAGKTGTGQVADGAGGYSKYNYEASFVGMVPASHPKLVVLVKVDDPRGSIYGGVVAAPAFAQIAKFDLQYLEIPPDESRTALSAGTPTG